MGVLKMYVWMRSSEEAAVLSPSLTLAQQGAGKVFGGFQDLLHKDGQLYTQVNAAQAD